MIGGILFLSCLSVVNFNLRYNLAVRDRDFIFGMHTPLMMPFQMSPRSWHAYSTNDALSKDTKVNDLVTLTLTLKLKIAFWTLLPLGAYFVFHKHILIFSFDT